jgi:PKD repeat protein
MPMTIDFTDASEGAIETYGWDFGDGGTSTLENPSHTYADPLAASYDVIHYVTNEKGLDSITKTVTVPSFTVIVGLTVNINADPSLNVVSALDFIGAAGDCADFVIGRASGGPFAATLTFECADRPLLNVYIRGTQTGTGITRAIPAPLTVTDSGGVCP